MELSVNNNNNVKINSSKEDENRRRDYYSSPSLVRRDRILSAHDWTVKVLYYHDNELFSGASDNFVRKWSLKHGDERQRFESKDQHKDGLRQVVATKKYVFTLAKNDNRIIVWHRDVSQGIFQVIPNVYNKTREKSTENGKKYEYKSHNFVVNDEGNKILFFRSNSDKYEIHYWKSDGDAPFKKTSPTELRDAPIGIFWIGDEETERDEVVLVATETSLYKTKVPDFNQMESLNPNWFNSKIEYICVSRVNKHNFVAISYKNDMTWKLLRTDGNLNKNEKIKAVKDVKYFSFSVCSYKDGIIYLCATDTRVFFWRKSDKSYYYELEPQESEIYDIVCWGEGDSLFIAITQKNDVILWKEELGILKFEDNIYKHHAGKVKALVTDDLGNYYSGSSDTFVVMRNIRGGSTEYRTFKHDVGLTAITRTDSYICSATYSSKSIYIWDPFLNEKPLHILKGHKEFIFGLCSIKDTIFSLSTHELYCWDGETGTMSVISNNLEIGDPLYICIDKRIRCLFAVGTNCIQPFSLYGKERVPGIIHRKILAVVNSSIGLILACDENENASFYLGENLSPLLRNFHQNGDSRRVRCLTVRETNRKIILFVGCSPNSDMKEVTSIRSLLIDKVSQKCTILCNVYIDNLFFDDKPVMTISVSDDKLITGHLDWTVRVWDTTKLTSSQKMLDRLESGKLPSKTELGSKHVATLVAKYGTPDQYTALMEDPDCKLYKYHSLNYALSENRNGFIKSITSSWEEPFKLDRVGKKALKIKVSQGDFDFLSDKHLYNPDSKVEILAVGLTDRQAEITIQNILSSPTNISENSDDFVDAAISNRSEVALELLLKHNLHKQVKETNNMTKSTGDDKPAPKKVDVDSKLQKLLLEPPITGGEDNFINMIESRRSLDKSSKCAKVLLKYPHVNPIKQNDKNRDESIAYDSCIQRYYVSAEDYEAFPDDETAQRTFKKSYELLAQMEQNHHCESFKRRFAYCHFFLKATAYFIFLVLFTLSAYYQSSNNSQHSALFSNGLRKSLVSDDFGDITTEERFWEWIHDPVLQLMHSQQLVETYGYDIILNGVRLRQIRTKPNVGCKINEKFESKVTKCYSWNIYEETNPYGPNGRFTWTKDSGDGSYWSPLGNWLPHSGYITDLPNDVNTTEELIDSLQSDHWIDQQTRAIIVTFTLYNANLNKLGISAFAFEFLPSGKILPSFQVILATAFPLEEAGGAAVLFVEIILIIYFIYEFLYKEISEIWESSSSTKSPVEELYDLWRPETQDKQSSQSMLSKIRNGVSRCWDRYITRGWNWFEWLIIILFIARIIVWINKISLQESVNVNNPTGGYVSYQQLGVYTREDLSLVSVLLLIMWMRLLKFLVIPPSTGIVTTSILDTLKSGQFFSFIVIFISTLLMFSLTFSIAYGKDVLELGNLGYATVAIVEMLFNAYDNFELLTRINKALTPFLFLLFTLFQGVMMMNLFIAVLTKIYSNASKDNGHRWHLKINEAMFQYWSTIRTRKMDNERWFWCLFNISFLHRLLLQKTTDLSVHISNRMGEAPKRREGRSEILSFEIRKKMTEMSFQKIE